MKAFFFAVLAMFVFGLGVLFVARSVQLKPWTRVGQEEEYKEFRRIIAIPVADSQAAKKPKADSSEQTFDFGVMPPFTDGSHIFTVTNTGDDSLAVRKGVKSCSCMNLRFAATLIEPGASHNFDVTWNTDKPGKLAQYVRLLTNSPDTPEIDLWVTGEVATILDVSVRGIAFESMQTRERRSQEFSIYSGVFENLTVDRIETSSSDVTCEVIEPEPMTTPNAASRDKEAELIKYKLDFRVEATAQSSAGDRVESVRIFVRPPNVNDQENKSGSVDSARPQLHAIPNLRPDGTVLIELPVSTRVVRRLSLYGPAIANGDKKLIDLGKLRTTSPAKDWSIIAKIRGDREPSDLKVALIGIDGVTASVEKIENATGQTGVSYRIKIHAEEKLRAAIYNREQAGKLTIEAPGLPGEELLEFTVELDVLEEN